MSETSTNIKVVNSISTLAEKNGMNVQYFIQTTTLMKQQIHLHAMIFYMHLKKVDPLGKHWLDPYHLAAFNKNKLVGAVPLYLKSNSQENIYLTTIGLMPLSVLEAVTIQNFKFQCPLLQ